MVAGKNNAQALARASVPSQLPPLSKLRIRRPSQNNENPCIGMLARVLGCWASQGGNAAHGCAVFEQQLRACMDQKNPPKPSKNAINSHLSKFWPQIRGPYKRK